ncbi:glycosyltransferase family 4 protein [bacterium]|nr:glycosyltransferase family 4 protein [bacterium]
MATDYFYPVLGGTEIQAYRLACKLSKKGIKVSVITRRHAGLPVSKPCSDMLMIYRLPIFGKKRKASIVFLGQVFFFLVGHRSEYDIIHCHLATSTALGCLMASLATRKPLLIKLGGSGRTGDIQTSLASVAGRLKLTLLKKGNCHFVAPSMNVANDMAENGFCPEMIRIIPNGVDTGHFCPISKEEKDARKHELGLDGLKLALYIGRLEQGKEILLLIDAWSNLSDKARDWRLWIIGSGSLENEVRSMIREKGMEERISLLPYVPPEEVRVYLQTGDIFINPSRAEGLSNSILEAMSCSLTVIASRIGGNKELIKEGFNGLLFDAGDACDLTLKIESAIQDDNGQRRWGMNARGHVVDDFDMSYVAKRYIDLYQGILFRE